MQRSFTFALLLVVCLLCIGPLVAQDAPIPEPVGLRPDAPEYAQHGPYWVGVKDFQVDGDEQPMAASIWYPALNPEGLPEQISYGDLVIKWDSGLTAGMVPTLEGRALRDAAPDLSGGPYPLVVFSPGYGEFRPRYAYLAEHLASYGFAVIIPDHNEFWTPDVPNLWRDSITRPQDMQFTITSAEALSNADGLLPGLIDTDVIGVLGHSYGGYTSLAMGGARIRYEEFEARCAALPADDTVGQAMCAPLLGHEADTAAFAGVADPTDLDAWPSWYDPRIKAVGSFAGDSYLFGESGMAEITVPLLVMGGTVDTSTPLEWGILPTYDHASSTQKAEVILENSDHFIFSATCAASPWVADLGWWFFCMEPVWDMDRGHDLVNHFTTAFLLSTLKGDAEATAALSPDVVSFPGVEYQAEGF